MSTSSLLQLFSTGVVGLAAILSSGCSLVYERVPTSRNPSAVQSTLSAVLDHYTLPSTSIAPTPNRDPYVDASIHSMQKVAEAQSLVFDGSRATDGIVMRASGKDTP